MEERNIYVSTHKKAKPKTGLSNIQKIAEEWRIDKFINLKLDGNQIVVEIDQDKKKELFALVAVMRKLLAFMHSIVKNNSSCNENLC
ncbi:hypothetical protein [Candidatus Tisiphia endosymbiont of Ptychoptera albimana]|uniref:hypothetical protein n=1 Tax=Candidatus Tisiphia endosymbiont of Ptychoptera albimana TaxID=3066260 RepID=UPI00312CB0D4